MKKRLLSLITVMAVAMTFVFSAAMVDGNAFAASKSKKYYLPTEIWVIDHENDGEDSLTNIKYDKNGNVTAALDAEMIPMQFKIKYKNKKKGIISRVDYGDGDAVHNKYYDKKGRLSKVVLIDDTYKYTKNKKGTIKKVTTNGSEYYTVKKIKYHKNGFVSKVVYSNGNINTYNSKGLMTSAIVKNGPKYTYKYTSKNGKVVKMDTYKDGKLYKEVTVKYGKKTTKDVWKYSCVICFAGGPSNACELYSKSSLSGINKIVFAD